ARNRDLARAASIAIAHSPKWRILSMRHSGEKCLALFGLFCQGLAKPCPGVFPVTIGDCPRLSQHLARFLNGESAEKMKVREPGGGGVPLPEPSQQFVHRQEQVRVLGKGSGVVE